MVIPGSPNSSTLQLLVDIAQDYALSQVNESTCLENILDLFFTNSPTQVQNVTVIPGLSNHNIVMITSKTKLPTYKQTQRKVPLYSRANWQAIKINIQHLKHDISNLITTTNINIHQLWEKFCNSIQNSLFKHIPHKKMLQSPMDFSTP